MRKLGFIALAAALVAVPTFAQAQNSGTGSVLAKVKVIKGLTVTALSAPATLDFGTQASGANTVTIAATNASAPGFHVTGEAATSLIFTVPATLNLTGPGAPVVYTPAVNVDNADATTGNQAGSVALAGTPKLNATGDMYFYVGGSIDLGATPTAHTAGNYSGTLTVTVAY